jgi:hypothetical protein
MGVSLSNVEALPPRAKPGRRKPRGLSEFALSWE